MKLYTYSEIESYLAQYIATGPLQLYVGDVGLRRAKKLLTLLGNPQEKIKVIHVAGTSGKGSTAYLISQLLVGLGKKTALHLSPHLIDIRERAQINTSLLSKDTFLDYFNEIIPFIELMKESSFGSPSYFEILSALSYFIAFREEVDYMIVETGLGGTYDATNSITREDKVCVITRIGYDHMQILGNTLSEIAAQKAGIIQQGNSVIALYQEPEIRNVFENRVSEKNGKLQFVTEGSTYSNCTFSDKETVFDFTTQTISFLQLRCGLLGSYQVENISLALLTVLSLSNRDSFELCEKNLRFSLQTAHFLGRLEVRYLNGKKVVLDGAHNPQKMEALLLALKLLYPEKKFHFLIGFSKNKDFKAMIGQLIPYASTITITQFSNNTNDMVHTSQSAQKIKEVVKAVGFSSYEVITNPYKALKKSLENQNSKNETLVITGSLYLLGALYSSIRE